MSLTSSQLDHYQGLTSIINAAGTMTDFGASAVTGDVSAAATNILPRFIVIDELQRRASQAIAASTGAETGCVTACAAAGLVLSVAASITGSDLGAISRLPRTGELSNEVIIQVGHLVNYGAPIDQAIRTSGASVRPIGCATETTSHDLRDALSSQTCAAVYVVSHHCVERGQIPLSEFIEINRSRGIPVIVDAASEYDLRGFISAGADVVIYSAHKFLGGLTAGILAGRTELIRACYLQHRGIGRPMKVGKEGIVGAIAALEAWGQRDHDRIRKEEEARVEFWINKLTEIGIEATRVPDPTGNPITRVRVDMPPECAVGAWDIATALAEREPRIIVRSDGVGMGFIELDPCNVNDEQAQLIADGLYETFESAKRGEIPPSSFSAWREAQSEAQMAWP